ncbi:MAG: methyltransferase domain-containing protein [Bacteroidetes bacterium]|jgi:SAM-dependent methyltransferase|nr:methyltransferase domain-containing protein [Bacteroidota bacterium]
MTAPNWRDNLQRRGGFWRHGRWYDLHLDRRMPLALPMLEELVAALPPLDADTAVCDLACGTGNAALTLLSAYPDVQLTLLDADEDLLATARDKIAEFEEDRALTVTTLAATMPTDGDPIPGGPYDVVLATLALHAIIGHDVDPGEAESRYELLLRGIGDSLTAGGHLLVGDHVGTLGLYRQLKAMDRAGFVDVDCAWRQDDFFVAGGRIPD